MRVYSFNCVMMGLPKQLFRYFSSFTGALWIQTLSRRIKQHNRPDIAYFERLGKSPIKQAALSPEDYIVSYSQTGFTAGIKQTEGEIEKLETEQSDRTLNPIQ